MAASILSVIIVNYNSGQLLGDCLASLYEHNPQLPFEVIVVDNSSNAANHSYITAAFPEVRWVDMGYNAGFARANNRGMQMAAGDAILLLNPDTLCIDDSITRCYRQFSQGTWTAAGLQLLDASGIPQISGSYFVKGGLNHLLPIPYWGRLIRWVGYKLGSKVPGVEAPKEVQEVDWISGAFLMVKKAAFQKVGGMDEDFFLYGEEVEWCSRLQKTGKLVIFGDMRIVHLEGATINKSQNIQEQGYYNLYDRKGLQLMVSNHVRVRKQYGVKWFLFLLLNYTWGVFFFGVCTTLHHLFTGRNPFRDWSKVGRFGANVVRLWKLAPTILRNKPHFYKLF